MRLRVLLVFYIIIGWGRIRDRIVSGLYLIFYTIVDSLPLFFRLILNYSRGYTDFFFLIESNYEYNFILFFFYFFSKVSYLWFTFMVIKSSCWGACLAFYNFIRSILKLGGFGLIRFLYEKGIRFKKDFLFFILFFFFFIMGRTIYNLYLFSKERR